jgi:restriction endonuclease Mrr
MPGSYRVESYMAVPDFQSLMRPVLDQYADGRERMAKDVREALGQTLGLADGICVNSFPAVTKRVS